MGKRFISLNGTDFYHMVLAGASNLNANVARINALNVFPVPDGDTGTNMNLTMTSGVEELKKRQNVHLGKAAEALSKGLLMGARGNSGVILSQLFRGFAKAVHDLEEANASAFAAALQQGVDTAYKAVMRPVEGTILTVSKEAAKHGVSMARRVTDLAELMKEVLDAGSQALARTPEQLPVLKQVGVVDAGGQGLICIYEGFITALLGGTVSEQAEVGYESAAGAGAGLSSALAGNTGSPAAAAPAVQVAFTGHVHTSHSSAQSKLRTEDIEHGYCTEFIVKLVPGKVKGYDFEETRFRQDVSRYGDSLLVVADDDLVKIHIHAEYPGEVMNYAMNYGDLTRIKIENMREQHTHILMEDAYESEMQASAPTPEVIEVTSIAEETGSLFGFVSVAAGDGITEIFASLGVDAVITGGQTMNPSTEDIVNAVQAVPAKTVFVLPNNSNIVLAAQQARELVEDKQVVVIPSKTIPQGMAAMLAFDERAEAEANEGLMHEAIAKVQSGQVTFAVRDTTIEGIEIKEGDYIGIHENRIVTSNRSLQETCRNLLDSMLESGGEVITILTGEDAKQEETDALTAYLQEEHPDSEVEIHYGGQPLYAYLFAVE